MLKALWKKLPRTTLASCLSAGFAVAGHTADYYLLVGGGPSPGDSQFSIEQNVVWLQPLLNDMAFTTGETWFGAGPQGQQDVVYHDASDPQSQYWEPLARVFGTQHSNTLHYRPNRITDNAGVISRDNIHETMEQRLASLGPGDSLLLVYSGHGSFNGSDRSKNALRLWGETRYSAADLAAQLKAAPAGSQVRFVLPQCFSGAFMRSVFTNPAQPAPTQLMPQHCGFVSVPDYRESEGCTPAVDIDDYRDYASYFFAALDGQTRTGDALSTNPDQDADGQVSLLEAHYYAFTEAQSTDVPRATSEYFLELTQPWYSRWLPEYRLRDDNPYLVLARRLAQRLDLQEPDAAAALALRKQLKRRESQLAQQLETQRRDEKRARNSLRNTFQLRWPQTQTAYGAMYQRFLETEQAAALTWIAEQPAYPHLVALQQAVSQTELALLDAQRQSAQAEKLQRALFLAHRLEQFERTASSADQARFAALRACESWTLPK